MENLPGVLHDALIGTGHVENYALIRRKDGIIKAASQSFSLRPEQSQFLLDVFKNTAILRERGLTFKSKFYECVRADKNSIYGKQVDGSGVIIVRTIAFVIIAQYSQKMSPAVCVEAVERLSDYFRDKGK